MSLFECLNPFFLSRLQDILVGAGVCFIMMGIILQFIDAMDHFLLTHPYAPLILISTTTLFLVFYPCKEGWTSTRKDTTLLLASFSGLMVGSWVCNQLGYLVDVDGPVPHPLVWPGWSSVGLMLLREFAGLAMIAVVYVIVRALVLFLMSIVMWRKIDRSNKKARTLDVELPFTFISNFCIALAMIVVAPVTFKVLGIPVYTFNV